MEEHQGHTCADCPHREGGWCNFVYSFPGKLPHHLAGWPINWDDDVACDAKPGEDEDE